VSFVIERHFHYAFNLIISSIFACSASVPWPFFGAKSGYTSIPRFYTAANTERVRPDYIPRIPRGLFRGQSWHLTFGVASFSSGPQFNAGPLSMHAGEVKLVNYLLWPDDFII
jgi:hypothetical protein